jgi:hypothetical protein
MKLRWDKLGGRLGLLYCLVGFVLIVVGWNGAASYDDVSDQIPYLLSGGLAGLALVVIGSAMLVVSGNRSDRAELQGTIESLRATLERAVAGNSAAAGDGDPEVLAGSASYHRPDCHLVEGQPDLTPMTAAGAAERGLEACRICNP